MQTQLGDLFYAIRFGSMALEEFSKLIPTYGQLFTAEEYAEIIQMIANKEFQSKRFIGIRDKRCNSDAWKWKKLISCYRLLSQHNVVKPYFIKNLETTKFSSNQPLLLMGITLAFIRKISPFGNCEDIPTEITITEMCVPCDPSKEVVILTGKEKISRSSKIVPLATPLLIQPGFIYEIRLEQNPTENYAIGTIVKSEVQMDDGITIQFHDDPKIPDDISSTGLIYSLDFCHIGK